MAIDNSVSNLEPRDRMYCTALCPLCVRSVFRQFQSVSSHELSPQPGLRDVLAIEPFICGQRMRRRTTAHAAACSCCETESRLTSCTGPDRRHESSRHGTASKSCAYSCLYCGCFLVM